ncbi:hypothetical protein Tco_0640068 [Tanacetum coccineum]
MSDEDVFSLLNCIAKDKEIKANVRNDVSSVDKQMMKVSLDKGNNVLVKEIVENDDVENKNEASISKVAALGEGYGTNIYGFFDSGLDDPVVWQHDNYHRDNEKEDAHLFNKLDQVLDHVAFLDVKLRESVVGVDPPVIAHVDARLIALEEEIQRPRKMKREIEDDSAFGIVTFRRPNKRRRLNPSKKTEKGITWMTFGGNTRDLGSFGEETDEITDLHQDSPRIVFTKRGDSVTSITRRRHDLPGDGVWILATTSQRSRLKVNLEPSTWRWRQEHQATPSR